MKLGRIALAIAVVGVLLALLHIFANAALGWAVAPVLIATFLAIAIAGILSEKVLGGSEGAELKTTLVKLGGSAAVLGAALWFINSELTKQMPVSESELARRVREISENLKSERTNADRLRGEMAKLGQDLAACRSGRKRNDDSPVCQGETIALDDAIENLSPDSDMAGRIRKIQRRKGGPWKPTSSQRDYVLSVAGSMRGRVASACDSAAFADKTVELTSLLVIEDEPYGSDAPIRVTRWRPLSPAVCDRFQIQVSCEIAKDLLTDKILRCEQDGRFVWLKEFDRLINVRTAMAQKGVREHFRLKRADC